MGVNEPTQEQTVIEIDGYLVNELGEVVGMTSQPKPDLEEGKSGVWVTLSDERRAFLGSKNISKLAVAGFDVIPSSESVSIKTVKA